MSEAPFRACPLCGTRNRHYMMVCTRCARSLEGVALVGTPPPGSVVQPSRIGRVLFGLLMLAAAAAVALLLSRLLRWSAFERDAAASTAAAGEQPPNRAPDGADRAPGWETLEQRFAELEGAPTATPPTPPPTTVAAAPPTTVAAAPPTTVAAAPPTTVAAAPPTTVPTPQTLPRPTVSTGPPVAHGPAAAPADGRAALSRAEERVRSLERRAGELRRRIHERAGGPRGQEEPRRELDRVLRQLEEADRQVIRAQWALRAVAP